MTRRDLKTLEECRAVVDLQVTVWGADMETVPAGLLLVWMPDQYATPFLYGGRPEWGDMKYVVGEALCLAGALGFLRRRAVARGD